MFYKMFQFLILLLSLFMYNTGAPQQPEINDQYETLNIEITTSPTSSSVPPPSSIPPSSSIPLSLNNVVKNKHTSEAIKTTVSSVNENKQLDVVDVDNQPLTTKLYTIIVVPVKKFIATPKVNGVLKNIGTCIVNGAMEIISHFFPPPLMPLIASAAGMIIPFEPVVMLKQKMPVTSYRRAIKTAVSGFMDTFSKYKVDSSAEDPYMTRRFHRRFMNNANPKEKNAIDRENL